MQYGPVLKKYSRDSYILQTKVGPKEDPAEFRAALEKSFTSLQLDGEGDYVDLLSIHGINRYAYVNLSTNNFYFPVMIGYSDLPTPGPSISNGAQSLAVVLTFCVNISVPGNYVG